MIYGERFYEVADWSANAAAASNGNVDAHETLLYGVLCFFTISGWPAPIVQSFENGKLYQTVELEAGTYRFDAVLWSNPNNVATNKIYVMASLGEGDNIPDTNDVESKAMAFLEIPKGVTTRPTLSIEFGITEKSAVSLGFVGTCGPGTTQCYFSKVALWRKF